MKIILNLCFALGVHGMNAQTLYFSNISDKNADQQSSFVSGDYIFAHFRCDDPFLSILDFSRPNVTFKVELSENGQVLEMDDFGLEKVNIQGVQTPGYIVLPIVSNPDGNCVSYKKNQFATYLPKALADLSAGMHTITCKIFCYNYKDGSVPMAEANFTLNIGNDAKAWYLKNSDLSYKAMIDRGLTYHLETYAAPARTGGGGANNVKVNFSSSEDIRIKIYSGSGSSQDFIVQANVTTTSYSVEVGSKIELLSMEAPYNKISDLYTVNKEMEGKTLKLK